MRIADDNARVVAARLWTDKRVLRLWIGCVLRTPRSVEEIASVQVIGRLPPRGHRRRRWRVDRLDRRRATKCGCGDDGRQGGTSDDLSAEHARASREKRNDGGQPAHARKSQRFTRAEDGVPPLIAMCDIEPRQRRPLVVNTQAAAVRALVEIEIA